MRKIMRNIIRRQGAAAPKQQGASVRAGMHQKAEHEYRHSRMSGNVPREIPDGEDPEMLPDQLPAALPGDGENPAAEEIAEKEAEISGESGILEEIADPDMSVKEEMTDPGSDQRNAMSADYSREKIPVAEPVTGGIGAGIDTPLVYSPGDGALKEISYPLSETERNGIAPYLPDVHDPSANVPESEEAAVPADEMTDPVIPAEE